MKPSQPSARGYLLSLIVLAMGSAVIWWAMSGSWAQIDGSLIFPDESISDGNATAFVAREAITGGDLSAIGSAAPLIGLAAVAGIIGSKKLLRRSIGAFVVLLGVFVAWSSISAWASLHNRSDIESLFTLYPIAAVSGGLALAAGGALAAIRGARWSSLGNSYERSASLRDQPKDAWDALDRGLDPTSDEAVGDDQYRQ
jgi:hypothetical protein